MYCYHGFQKKEKNNKIKELFIGNFNNKIIHINENSITLNRESTIKILLLLFIFILFFNYANQEILRKLNAISKIHLCIKGNGNQNILSNSFSGKIPDQIIINGIIQNKTGKVANNLNNDINNITLIWNNKPSGSYSYMFQNLINVTKIDMSEFDSSLINDMTYMFSGCKSLKELNLNNLDTSSVTVMQSMFSGCNSLTSLNLSSFNTHLVTFMSSMFNGCSSLKYLNLHSFDIRNVNCICNMFNGCSSLLYLNLYSFVETSVMTSYCSYSNVFSGCNSLKYCMNSPNLINIKSYLDSSKNCGSICSSSNSKIYINNNICLNSCPKGKYISSTHEYICLDNCPNYIDYYQEKCIDEMPIGYYMNDSIHKTIDKCDIKCENCSLESILNNNFCISCNNKNKYYPIFNNITNNNSFVDCSNQILEGYYFDNEINYYMPCYSSCKFCFGAGEAHNNNCSECYEDYILKENNCLHECGHYYYFDTIANDYLCTEKCPSDLEYINEDNICVNNCKMNDIFRNNCKIINIDDAMKDDLVDRIRGDLLNGELDDLISKVVEGDNEDLIIGDVDILYQITSSYNQNHNLNNDRANIQLGECETILRNYYNMSEKDPLIIFKIDLHEEGLLIPTVTYEIYDLSSKQKLNLSLCDEEKIKVLFPANIDSYNLDIYDPNSKFYNDICYSHSINGVDMITNDRKSDFVNKNLSLCESNCEYEGYNSTLNKSECDCEIKIKLPLISEIVINKNKLFNKLDIKNSTNLKVLKCYYVLFTFEGLISNIGSYILLVIILINIVCLILCFTFGYESISIIISKILCKPIERSIEKIENSNTTGKKIRKQHKNKINNIINKNNIKIIIQNKNYVQSQKTKNNNPPKIKNLSRIKDNDIYKKTKKQKKESKTSSRIGIITKNNLETLNVNEKIKERAIFPLNDYQLNTLLYADALKYDKRTYFMYYVSLLKRNQILIFTFYSKNDYNLRSIKISKFFFVFALSYAINALFFTDENMHSIFISKGKFNIIYQIPKILYSSFLSSLVNTIIQIIAFSEKYIIQIKNEKHQKDKKKKAFEIKKFLIIKFIIYFIVVFLLLFLFWYYISCFCAVYKNTQIYLIKEVLINFGLTNLYPLFISLFPGIFRIPSLRAKKQDKQCLYQFSKMMQYI